MMMPAVMTPQKIDSSARVWHFQQRCDQRTRPRAGSRKRNSNEQIQSETGVFCDLAAFAQQLFLVRSGKFTQRRQGFRPCKQLFPEHEQQRNGEHITEDGQREKRRPRDSCGRAEPGTAPRSSTSGTMEMIKTAASRPAPSSQSNNAENNLLLLFFEILLLFYPLSTENARALL